jgi:hypothetical protein
VEKNNLPNAAGHAGKVNFCTEGKKWAAEDGSNPGHAKWK